MSYPCTLGPADIDFCVKVARNILEMSPTLFQTQGWEPSRIGLLHALLTDSNMLGNNVGQVTYDGKKRRMDVYFRQNRNKGLVYGDTVADGQYGTSVCNATEYIPDGKFPVDITIDAHDEIVITDQQLASLCENNQDKIMADILALAQSTIYILENTLQRDAFGLFGPFKDGTTSKNVRPLSPLATGGQDFLDAVGISQIRKEYAKLGYTGRVNIVGFSDMYEAWEAKKIISPNLLGGTATTAGTGLAWYASTTTEDVAADLAIADPEKQYITFASQALQLVRGYDNEGSFVRNTDEERRATIQIPIPVYTGIGDDAEPMTFKLDLNMVRNSCERSWQIQTRVYATLVSLYGSACIDPSTSPFAGRTLIQNFKNV